MCETSHASQCALHSTSTSMDRYTYSAAAFYTDCMDSGRVQGLLNEIRGTLCFKDDLASFDSSSTPVAAPRDVEAFRLLAADLQRAAISLRRST
jgi:hypothetical protein